MAKDKNEISSFSASNLSTLLHSEKHIPQFFSREVFLIQTRVEIRETDENIKEKISALHEGDALTFLRDLDDPHDPSAVRVLAPDGGRIGRLSLKDDTIIANLMDAGKRIYARVFYINPDWEQTWNLVWMNVYMED